MKHKHGTMCVDCHNHTQRHVVYPPLPSSPSPPPPSSLSMYGRPSGCIDQLSLVERAAIITLHNIGWAGQDIAQELHCSENTVSLWWTRWKETRSLEDNERSGRPRSTSDDTDQDIGLHTWENADQSARVVLRELGLRVSWRTIRRRMNEIGLLSHVKHYEQELTDEHREKRVQWAKDYSHWSEEDWARVLFSDEKNFYLNYLGRSYVNCPVGESRDPKYIRPIDKLEGKVSLWGCICNRSRM